MSTTTKQNLVIPTVMADAIQKKMVDAIKLAPLAEINMDLVGNGGDTIQVPFYNYIGDAADLGENVEGEVDLLTATTVPATVKKIFKAVELTDEAIMSNFTNPLTEVENQLALSLASKVEKDCFTVALTSTNTFTDTENGISTIGISAAAVALFGEDLDGIYCFVSPTQFHKIRTEAGFTYVNSGAVVISGEVGEVYGVKIVVSSRVQAKNIFLKAGGLQISLKKDVEIETDRDILRKTTVIAADRHYVAHILNANKVGVATFKN